MKKIVNLLLKNPTIKLISLLSAILIWFMCMNLIDPIESKGIKTTLVLKNLDVLRENNRVLMNEDLSTTEISVLVKGPVSAINELDNNKSNLTASVNFKMAEILNATQIRVPLDTLVYSELTQAYRDKGLTVIETSPRSVAIMLDKITTRSVKIEISESSIVGSPADGFVIGDISFSPSIVTVTCSEFDYDKIKHVTFSLDVTGAKNDLKRTLALKVFNKDDEDITALVKLSAETAEVTVPINKKSLVPISKPALIGEPEDGYVVTSYDFTPKSIELIGKSDDLVSLKSIKIDDINITGINASVTKSFNILSFVDVSKFDIDDDTVYLGEITINVEKKIDREFEIDVKNINFKGLVNDAEFKTEKIYIMLRGSETLINELTNDSIKANVDFTNLELGENRVLVSFELPSKVEIVSEEQYIDVMIKEPVETEPVNGEEGTSGSENTSETENGQN